ncbi:hypothetical protein AX774_g5620 [Zancudomyces culisetae]|uniref:Uncharacterized protein n=1 Tax=Zancudomyces culisetae TaxID=1213189 RepID=A0A1R1PJ97_ZANCU|nr:hypothetical protein AX774_g5620 [Zancudomyces culisetae]|eukprot:OMH80932.1 hypothetical protein AX774_g5620 [Zancudomyces culisetae]
MDTTQSTATAAAAATRYFNYVFSKGDFLHAFISELVGSCIFVIAVFAITDIKNVSMRHTAPIAIGMSYAGCKLIFGFTDYGGSFNPILDIAFRTLTWMVFGSLDILKKTTIFMVASIVGSFLGGFIGASIYELLTWSNQEYRTKVGDK